MDISHKIYIVKLIYELQEKYGKHYCFPSQIKICELLGRIYEINRSVRTANRWMRALEDQKLFKRVRRVRRGPTGNPVFSTTMYFLSLKGLKLLHKFGFDVWSRLQKYYDRLNSRRNHKNTPAPAATGEAISVDEMKQIWALKKSKVGT